MASHLLHRCLLGVLSRTTRLLCTHRTEYLEKADVVLLMEAGRLVRAGSVGRRGGSRLPRCHRGRGTDELSDVDPAAPSVCGLGPLILLSHGRPCPAFTEWM